MLCLPSLLNIMVPCLMEVPRFAKNNAKIFKINTVVTFMTTLIKIKKTILSSTKDHNFSLSNLLAR